MVIAKFIFSTFPYLIWWGSDDHLIDFYKIVKDYSFLILIVILIVINIYFMPFTLITIQILIWFTLHVLHSDFMPHLQILWLDLFLFIISLILLSIIIIFPLTLTLLIVLNFYFFFHKKVYIYFNFIFQELIILNLVIVFFTCSTPTFYLSSIQHLCLLILAQIVHYLIDFMIYLTH